MIAIYLNTRVKSSNFHTIILKKSFRKKTYIMGLGYAGGRVYDEFFGQFLTNDSGEDIGKVSNSIGPYDWEKSVKISYDDETFEGVCKIDELFEQLNGVETNVRDNIRSRPQKGHISSSKPFPNTKVWKNINLFVTKRPFKRDHYICMSIYKF